MNIGPSSDGSIEPIFQERLRQVFLKMPRFQLNRGFCANGVLVDSRWFMIIITFRFSLDGVLVDCKWRGNLPNKPLEGSGQMLFFMPHYY